MTVEIDELATALRRIAAGFETHENDLNAADARLGDGDTGTMLRRLSAALSTTDLGNAATLTDAFKALAAAASASTGSSLGTLIVTGLMACTKSAPAASRLDVATLPVLLDEAVRAMLKRGGAALGDKTALDGVAAVSEALRATPAEPAREAATAARAALVRFRDHPNRIGRAGRYGDKSRGFDDPGMLAVATACDAIAGQF